MNPVAIDPHRIRDLAYARWQERGCPQGSAEQDWLEAEQAMLRAQGARERAAVASSPSVTLAAQTLAAQTLAAQTVPASKFAQKEAPSKEATKRAKPPRPTLKRSPNARAAKLLNEVTPKPPTETRAQKAVAAATAAPVKRTAVGSG